MSFDYAQESVRRPLVLMLRQARLELVQGSKAPVRESLRLASLDSGRYAHYARDERERRSKHQGERTILIN